MSCFSGVKSLVSIIIIILNVTSLTGMAADYYIALGLTYKGKFEFPTKKFFWCLTGDYEFKEMPELNDAHPDFVNGDSFFFQGFLR